MPIQNGPEKNKPAEIFFGFLGGWNFFDIICFLKKSLNFLKIPREIMIMVFWGIFILLIGSNRRLKYLDRSFFGYRVCANLAWGLI
jgi:hypothetical protein